MTNIPYDEMPECNTCGKPKSPRGRDVPDANYCQYCTGWQCDGYMEHPLPLQYWPGERQSNAIEDEQD